MAYPNKQAPAMVGGGPPIAAGKMHCVNLYFRCTAVGTVTLNEESSEFAWLTPQALARKLSGNVVATTKIHLIGRLAGEGRMRNHRVVPLHIEADELLQGRKGVELVQVEPAVFQGTPPCLDHRVREADLDLSEHPAKRTGSE